MLFTPKKKHYQSYKNAPAAVLSHTEALSTFMLAAIYCPRPKSLHRVRSIIQRLGRYPPMSNCPSNLRMSRDKAPRTFLLRSMEVASNP